MLYFKCLGLKCDPLACRVVDLHKYFHEFREFIGTSRLDYLRWLEVAWLQLHASIIKAGDRNKFSKIHENIYVDPQPYKLRGHNLDLST